MDSEMKEFGRNGVTFADIEYVCYYSTIVDCQWKMILIQSYQGEGEWKPIWFAGNDDQGVFKRYQQGYENAADTSARTAHAGQTTHHKSLHLLDCKI